MTATRFESGNLCSAGALTPAQLQHPSVLPHLVAMLSSSNALAKGPAAAAIASMAYQPALRQQLISQRPDRRPLRARPTSPRCDSRFTSSAGYQASPRCSSNSIINSM